jgi:hypothetical protein
MIRGQRHRISSILSSFFRNGNIFDKIPVGFCGKQLSLRRLVSLIAGLDRCVTKPNGFVANVCQSGNKSVPVVGYALTRQSLVSLF